MAPIEGYAGKILRIDLTTGISDVQSPEPAVLRKYLGGPGLGMKLLWEEVPQGVKWSDLRID